MKIIEIRQKKLIAYAVAIVLLIVKLKNGELGLINIIGMSCFKTFTMGRKKIEISFIDNF